MVKSYFNFFKCNQTLFLIIFFFGTAILYHYVVVPFRDNAPESKKTEGVENALVREIDIDSDYPEKVYSRILDARKGDVYRIGVRVYSEKETTLEVMLRSDFGDTVLVGEWKIDSFVQEGSFKEIVFMAPGRFTDVTIRLKKEGVGDKSNGNWMRDAVSLDSFFVTRLDAMTWSDIQGLEKTQHDVAGITGARLEDIGEEWLYKVSLTKNQQLTKELFSQSEGVSFDKKRGLISGEKKIGEYFVYKFDMKHPFERLVLRAEQLGETSKEIKLDYSLDNKEWEQIEYDQKKGESQKFQLLLSNLTNEGTIFIRATYQGTEKQKGSFSLKSLSLEALLSDKSQ